ncbi:PAS domain-containing sensor histidine kinase [Saccharicrinis sp. FJH62]|uniref:sensor histidine kinase n=1 Tax=Saccharicrinis sp. FJH62 TaxID=3344657 RepID=UPI0035D402B4
MAYRRFNLILNLRILILILLTVATGYTIGAGLSWMTSIALLLLDIISVLALIRFLNTTNKQISYFIQAVKNDDTTLRFPPETGNKIINELHEALNELNIILQQTKQESRIKERYFSEILQNIATGVMVINERGFITEVNTAILELLGLQTLTHMSQLSRVDPKFKSEIDQLDNHQKQVLTLNGKNDKTQVIARCSVINLKHENIKLITIQDIRGELERKEIDSWVKLIRVLSHEIMNTLAPVTSIAQTLKGIWKEKIKTDASFSKDDDIESTIGGLDVIGERGEALIRFVQSYRILTKAPQPKLAPVEINSFSDRIKILISPLKEDFKGEIRYNTQHEEFTFIADEQMVVQVVINLVKNAIEALGSIPDPVIEIACEKANNAIEISVSDNGDGIPEDILDEIFIPFFTTKENGSGIGLSLSRQIMRLHGGTLKVSSSPETGTRFTMVIPER